MDFYFAYFLAGFALGSTMSVIPSPLLALLVNETLKYGKYEGIKISIIPILTDLPIIAVSLLIISQLSKINIAFAAVSFLGFLFLSYLGIKGFFSKGIKSDTRQVKPQTIKKGLILNFLNPNAYIFWLTVGSPILISY
jgi:threonine/homoserine/homoserine lactone efflux protein